MRRKGQTKPRCFLAMSFSPITQHIREVAHKSAQIAGYQVRSLVDMPTSANPIHETLAEEIGKSDCIIADLSGYNPNVFFEIGLAIAMGKGLFLIVKRGEMANMPFDLRGYTYILYDDDTTGMSNLRTSIVRALALYKDEPKKRRTGSQLNNMQFSIDWERLDRSDVDNLCFELLTQMGFSKIAWETRASEIDITAETSKKDPDGYEYRELWLIGLGRKTSLFKLLDMARKDPEYLLHRLMRSDLRSIHFSDRIESMSSVTLLIITDEDYPIDDFERMRQLSLPMSSIETINLRIRVWDRAYLASLIRQFPMIGYKYFSEEGRAQSKYRKTPEELYRENLELNRNLVNTLAAYEEEKNRRIRAERDAIWKDISYSAAHKIGNPIFAIETNLDPLQRRIDRNNAGEATEIVNDIRFSVEKAKGIVDQFKSLARSQEIKIISTLIKPLIIDACGVAKNNGIVCMIDCEDNIRVLGDPDKLGECFDELVANSLSWFDKPEKSLTFSVKVATEDMLPTTIDTSKRYAIIYVQDNGTGVPTDKKDDIFNAFVTTRDHGTGLGLALVRRIIEGHAGIIRETGMPGQGALFEIYIPLAEG